MSRPLPTFDSDGQLNDAIRPADSTSANGFARDVTVTYGGTQTAPTPGSGAT